MNNIIKKLWQKWNEPKITVHKEPKVRCFVPKGYQAYFFENNKIIIVAQHERAARRQYFNIIKDYIKPQGKQVIKKDERTQ